MTNKVLLIYTGGTIGMGKNPVTGALEPLNFTHLLRDVHELKYLKIQIDIEQFATPIDSSDMSPEIWKQLATLIISRFDNYDGFVVLHGTDTMAYTAAALSFMLGNLTKPVILTGSQLPIGQPRTDGKENLVTSLELATTYSEDGRPMVPEVCIYFSGRLLRGNRSTKINADGFHAFESFNYPHLCDAGVTFNFHGHHILCPDYKRLPTPHLNMDTNVAVFSLFPGIQENIVEQMLNVPGLKAIVMRSFGSGNAPQSQWLLRLLRNATLRGVTVVNISQCIAGFVEMNRYDTGFQLKDAGVISGYDSTVEAAVTKLMHLHGTYAGDNETISHLMEQSIAGEITS